MYAVETSKNVAIQGGTVGLGAAVVAAQVCIVQGRIKILI